MNEIRFMEMSELMSQLRTASYVGFNHKQQLMLEELFRRVKILLQLQTSLQENKDV